MKPNPGGPTATPHPWSKEALLAKARRYAEAMLTHNRNDVQFGLASTFLLEFVARAALANINPVLLAELPDWNNVYFAIGGKPKAAKFKPKSAAIGVVLDRLNEIYPTTFDAKLKGEAIAHISRRNEELHSGATPFDEGSTAWLPSMYNATEVLLKSMGESLESVLGNEEAKAAKKIIAAAKDESALAIKQAIHQHKTKWEALKPLERARSKTRAGLWATRSLGHRVACPACGSPALVYGDAITEPQHSIKEGMVIEKQDHLPSRFECIACGLKIAGLAQINAAGLGASFTLTRTYDLADYFGDQVEFDGYEEDHNEP
jgi:hypothetical protein